MNDNQREYQHCIHRYYDIAERLRAVEEVLGVFERMYVDRERFGEDYLHRHYEESILNDFLYRKGWEKTLDRYKDLINEKYRNDRRLIELSHPNKPSYTFC